MQDKQLERRCTACATGPMGRQGHEQMAPRLGQLNRRMRDRVILVFTCQACGTQWARKRLEARKYRWLPFA